MKVTSMVAIAIAAAALGCGGSGGGSTAPSTVPAPTPAPTPDSRIGRTTVRGGTLTLTPQTSDRCGNLDADFFYTIHDGPVTMRDYDLKINDRNGLVTRSMGDFDSGPLEPGNWQFPWPARGCVFGSQGQVVTEGIVNYVSTDGAVHQMTFSFSGFSVK